MHKLFAALTKWITGAIASPWALGVSLAFIAFYVVAGPLLGFPAQRVDLGFLLTFTTFVLVFVIEHQGYGERAAVQTKLDELIRALDADRSKIGIEERSPKEIDAVRVEARERDGRAAAD